MSLPLVVVAEVQRLLAAGMSCRGIARHMAGQVSYTSVGVIARGEHREPKPKSEEQRNVECTGWDGTVGRCPTCGALVMMPCYACRVNANLRLKRTKPKEIERETMEDPASV